MPQITFVGVSSRSGIGSDPVVFIDTQDHTRFNQSWSTHNIFTQIIRHPHPDTGLSCPTINISQRAAQPFQGLHPLPKRVTRPSAMFNRAREGQ